LPPLAKPRKWIPIPSTPSRSGRAYRTTSPRPAIGPSSWSPTWISNAIAEGGIETGGKAGFDPRRDLQHAGNLLADDLRGIIHQHDPGHPFFHQRLRFVHLLGFR
jgi:hypothetical protein